MGNTIKYRIPFNNVAVNIPRPAHDKIAFGESELYLDTTYTFTNHICHVGTVECLPDKLVFDKENNYRSLRWKTENELKVGDTVWVNRRDMAVALGDLVPENKNSGADNKYIINDDNTLTVFVRYDSIWFVKRKEEYFPINGWLIIEPMEEEKYEGNLIIPETAKKGYNTKLGKVLYAAQRIEEYGTEGQEDCFNIKAGDIVFLPRYGDIPLENELHETLPHKKLFICQRHRIVQVWSELQALLKEAGIEAELEQIKIK